MSKHTPGPWQCSPVLEPDLEDDPMGLYKIEPAHTQLTKRYFDAEPETPELEAAHAENNANARLIAAAPNLLAALHDIAAAAARIVEDDDKPTLIHMRELNRCRQRAIDTIAKAETE